MKTVQHLGMTSIATGFIVGAITYLLRQILPHALDPFVNSGAIWVSLAFLLGVITKSARQSILYGVAAVMAELGGYYLLESVTMSRPLRGAGWLPFAIVFGSMLGYAGYVYKNGQSLRRYISSIVLGGVFVVDGILFLTAAGHYLLGIVWIAMGILITTMLARRIHATRR